MHVIAQNRCAAWWASIVVMGMLLLVGGQNALAVCSFGGRFTDATFVLLPAMVISRNTAVGSVLYTTTSLITQPQGLPGTCTANGDHTVVGYLATMQTVAGMTRVYQTNIPGIGVRVKEVSNSRFVIRGAPHYKEITLEANAWQLQWTHVDRIVGSWNSFQAELIVTGPVSPGMLSLPSPLAGVYSSDSPTGLTANSVLYARLLTSGTTEIIAHGCIVGNNAIAVRLPAISSSNLNSVGATAGATRFAIALTCYHGIKVAYQFEGISPTGTVASLGILANRTNTGDATGVGVQILPDGSTTPVPLDNTLSATFVTTTSYHQPVSIPFVARYVRIGAAMTMGTVWARATFTMNYQ